MDIDATSYPALLAPLRLGSQVLRNRLVHASMSTRLSERQEVTPPLIQYHLNRALGGAAMTVTEPLGMAPHQAQLDRPQVQHGGNLDGLKRWADAVESRGCRLIGQIQDSGRGRHHPGRTLNAVGASALPDDLSWTVPRALAVDEIERMVDAFAQSCARLQRCGFSGVELSAGHGHLFHQFLSPWSNRREDAYGRDWEGRTRFVAEIVAAIRATCGERFLVGLKLPGDDGVRGGIGPADAALIASRLTAGREVDYVCFAQGAHAGSLEMHLPDRHGPRLPYLALTRRLRSSVHGVPVIALGRITDPAEAEAILQRGDAEMIGLGRALVADPAWLGKAARNRAHDIRYCLSCNTCWGAITSDRAIACVNNPRVARPDEVDFWPARAVVPRRVTVVGAGVAGLEAAWVAAARGHAVTVFGCSGRVGGKARLREGLPGGETITSIYDYQHSAAIRAGARFELGVAAGLDEVLATRPDVVVLACGSSMIAPSWLPAEIAAAGLVPDLRTAIERLGDVKGPQRGAAVLFDMDHSEGTYAAAEFLKGLFARVVILTPRDAIATEIQLVTRQGILRRAAEQRIEVMTSSAPIWTEAFEDGLLACENLHTGERGVIADVSFLAYSTPRVPNDLLAAALRRTGVEVHAVGDCRSAGELLAATATGHAVGNAL